MTCDLIAAAVGMFLGIAVGTIAILTIAALMFGVIIAVVNRETT